MKLVSPRVSLRTLTTLMTQLAKNLARIIRNVFQDSHFLIPYSILESFPLLSFPLLSFTQCSRGTRPYPCFCILSLDRSRCSHANRTLPRPAINCLCTTRLRHLRFPLGLPEILASYVKERKALTLFHVHEPIFFFFFFFNSNHLDSRGEYRR